MSENYMRIAMISNEKWVVPAGGRERRFAVFDASSARIGDVAYFEQMDQQMSSGGLEAMLYELLNWVPENGWNALYIAPVTSGLREQIVESLRGLDRFMYELLLHGIYECENCVEDAIRLNEDTPTEISMTELRMAARDYLVDHFTGHKAATFNMLEPRVIEWFGATIGKKKINANNVRWITFPPLSECRDHVRRTKGLQINGTEGEHSGDGSPTLH